MHFNILFGAALISQALSVSALPTGTVQLKPINPYAKRAVVNTGAGETKLAPIKADHFNRRLGKRAATEDDYGRMDPMDQVEMLFGAEQKGGGMFVANMTMEAPAGARIINMETFEGFTTKVDCSTAGDGKISLTFKDQQSFEYAINKWGWLNEQEEHQFVMVTNHDGCGPDAERIPYLVNKVDYDETTFTTDLFATETAWDQVASNYTVHFGKVDTTPTTSNNTSSTTPSATSSPSSATTSTTIDARGLGDFFSNVGDCLSNPIDCASDIAEKLTSNWDSLTDAVKQKIEDAKENLGDLFNTVQEALGELGDGTKDASVDLDLTTGTPGEKKSIWPILATDNANSGDTVDCIDCYIKGKFQFSGHLRFENFIPQEAYIEIAPEDFSAMMKFNVKLLTNTDSPLNFEVDVYTIPLGALTVPHIFSFGPKFDFEVGMSAQVNKDVDFNFGFQASLPNDAIIHKDILDKENANASGWDNGGIDTLPFELNSGEVDIQLEASANAVLGVGIEALGFGGYEAAIRLKLPRVSSSFTTIENAAGACEQSDTAATTAIEIKSDVNIDLIFYIGDDVMSNPNPDFEKTIFTKKFPLSDQCKPITDNRNTNPSTTTSSVPTATGTGVGTGVPIADPSLNSTFSMSNTSLRKRTPVIRTLNY